MFRNSIIFGDMNGNFNISRPDQPGLTSVTMLESREYRPRRNTRTNIMVQSIRSESHISDSSESEFGSASFDEMDEIDEEEGNIRNMPWCKSIRK